MHLTDSPATDVHALREALIAKIDSLGNFHTPQVKAAFRAVPRHIFLPGVDLTTAYAPKPVVTKRAEDDTAISSASSPSLVATMLEQLDVQPSHRVLEIGAATGINAALLSELVGPTGSVVTVELDEDLADGARSGLAAAGYDRVEVICGDGALGDPSGKTFDRIIVTARRLGHLRRMVAATRSRRTRRRAASSPRQRPDPLPRLRPHRRAPHGQR